MKRYYLIPLILVFLIGCKKNSTEPVNNHKLPEEYQSSIKWESLADASWPMFQHDPQNTGRSEVAGPIKGAIKWKKNYVYGAHDSYITFYNSIFFTYGSFLKDSLGNSSAYLVNMSPDSGSIIWKKNLCPSRNKGNEIQCGPVISRDGTIYAGASEGVLFAMNSDGSVRWTYDTKSAILAGRGGINLDRTGNIYFSTNDYFYALDNNGHLKWKSNLYSSQKAVFSADGNLIYIKRNGNIDAIDLNGDVKWSFPVNPGNYIIYIISDNQGNIYFADNTNNLRNFYSVDKNGNIRWKYTIDSNDDFTYMSPTIDRKGNVYFSTNNFLYSISYKGELGWKKYFPGLAFMHLICDNNSNVYGADSDNLYSISPDGKLIWSVSFGPSAYYLNCASAIGSDGTIYIITSNRDLTSTVFAIN